MIDFILRPFRRNFGKDKRFYAAIDDMFGFIPNNIELYKLALIHKSASIVTEDGRHVNNERLEYLGDAVIESVTSDYLFIEYPERDEGFLTQLRSKMVSRQTLNDVAKRIGLDDYVISNTSNNMSQKHIYGDAFEAMMGAIYLDQGYDFVNRLLINKIFVEYIKVDRLSEAETDFKSRLIEWCQKNHHAIRFYTQNDKSYSSAHPTFYSKVLIDNIEVGYGAGDSKKEAEQRAAYSVAHGVSDADCTMLMNKLDALEVHQLKSSKSEKREPKASREMNRAEVSAVKEVESVEAAVEEKTEASEKPQSTARRRTRKKVEAKSVEVAAEISESDVETSKEQPAEAATKSRRPRSRKKSADANVAKNGGDIALDSNNEAPFVEDSAKADDATKSPRPKRSRSRKSVLKKVVENSTEELKEKAV